MTSERETSEPLTLPELEQQLLRAARLQTASRVRGRRWGMPALFASLLVAGGVAAATAGVLQDGDESQIDSGQTSSGNYVIRIKPDSTNPHPGGPICLQLRFAGYRPAYGCGSRPTAENPFGVVIADASGIGSTERVIYGLVSSDVWRVSVLGDGDDHIDTTTTVKQGLPGRYFSVAVPNDGRIEIVGYDAGGAEVARLGSRREPTNRPLSREQAVAQGDPAGFAPTVVPASSFLYQGDVIAPERAAALHLVCVDTPRDVQCYGSAAEAESALAAR